MIEFQDFSIWRFYVVEAWKNILKNAKSNNLLDFRRFVSYP